MRVSSSKQMSPGMQFFFSLILVVVGASVAFFGIRGLIRAKASTDWPTTQGKVLASSVQFGGGGSDRSHHAQILYEFSVEGTTFKGDRVAYGEVSSLSYAYNVVDRYPKGKNVTVYYTCLEIQKSASSNLA